MGNLSELRYNVEYELLLLVIYSEYLKGKHNITKKQIRQVYRDNGLFNQKRMNHLWDNYVRLAALNCIEHTRNEIRITRSGIKAAEDLLAGTSLRKRRKKKTRKSKPSTYKNPVERNPTVLTKEERTVTTVFAGAHGNELLNGLGEYFMSHSSNRKSINNLIIINYLSKYSSYPLTMSVLENSYRNLGIDPGDMAESLRYIYYSLKWVDLSDTNNIRILPQGLSKIKELESKK